MLFRELIRFAFRALRRQKMRTLLTTLGVGVGACSLAFSVALGVGLRKFVDREFSSRPGFWEIQVLPGLQPPPIPESEIPPAHIEVKGHFSPERIQRLRYHLVRRYQQRHSNRPLVKLDDRTIEAIRALPGVREVTTARWGQGHCYWNGKSGFINIVAGRCDMPLFAERLVQGRAPDPAHAECALSETLLYDMGVADDAGMAAVLGTVIDVELGGRRDELAKTVEYQSLTPEEQELLKQMLAKAPARPIHDVAKGRFTVVGIVRGPVAGDESVRSGYVFRWSNFYTGGAEAEAVFRKLPHLKDGHYDNVEARIEPGNDLVAVVDAIEAMGLRTSSAAEWFNNARREVTLIGAGLNVFAIVALIVAALGITNTLVTSVVERTREIGMLKAVGATSGQVRKVFLIEGVVIGVFGGLAGLALARLLAGPADDFIRNQVEKMMRGQEMLSSKIIEFPLWLCLGTPAFASIITLLAAMYPAHRAARITPIEALRYG